MVRRDCLGQQTINVMLVILEIAESGQLHRAAQPHSLGSREAWLGRVIPAPCALGAGSFMWWSWGFKKQQGDFTGGPVVKHLPANSGGTGSVPGLGRSHMSRGN